jgi:NAD(P)-dependent dehydrogenase (short-subunit alcohol dehydrogenase family)
MVIVTGAGRGGGLGISERLCREGAQVVLGELVEARGHAAAEQFRAIHLFRVRTLFPSPGATYYTRPNGHRQ